VMQDIPLVTVVIPTFNKAKTIEATVKSVLRQTYPSVEIILVDNGSTDSTRAVISGLAESLVGLRVINLPENLGPSNARNTGIRNSNGRYIFLLDGDDLFHPNKIAIQVAFMQANPDCGLSVTSYLTCALDRSNLRHVNFKSIKSQINGWMRMTGFGGLVESTGCLDAIKIQDSLMFDTSLMGSEGLDFMMMWFQKHKVGLIHQPLTLYLLSENQLHLNTRAIKENVTRLSKRYINNSLELFFTQRLQASFFALDGIRNRGLFFIAVKTLASFDVFQFIMGFSIVKRNINAYFSGSKHKSELIQFFARET
jgi:glycosyltransferase involved in cell wall biosynthesis